MSWWTKIRNFAEKAEEKILPVAGAIGGGIVGGPWGAAAGYELGDTGAGLLEGKSLGDAAKAGLPGAALSAVGAEFLPGVGNYLSNTFPETLSSIGLGGSSAAGDIAASTGGSGSVVDPNLFDETAAPGVLPSTGADASAGAVLPSGVGSTAAPAVLPSTAAATTPALSVGQNLGQGNFLTALKQLGISPMQAAGGVGLAASALKGSKATGADKNLESYAGTEAATGRSQISLGESGQLNPGQTAALQQELQDGITQIKSRYAELGMSGSSSEAAAIAQAQQAYAGQVAKLAQGEITTGLTALGQADSATQALANGELQSDNELATAIAALAGSPSISSNKQPAA